MSSFASSCKVTAPSPIPNTIKAWDGSRRDVGREDSTGVVGAASTTGCRAEGHSTARSRVRQIDNVEGVHHPRPEVDHAVNVREIAATARVEAQHCQLGSGLVDQ